MIGTVLLACIFTISAQNTHPLHDEHVEAQKKWVDSIYAEMSLEEKVGQLFMVRAFSDQGKAHENEVAELINNYLRLANRLYEIKPEICTEIVNKFVNAVDPFEIGEAIKLVFAEMRDELRPIARSVVPGVVEWVCDVLQPEEDEYEDNAARAREALRTLLMAEEV